MIYHPYSIPFASPLRLAKGGVFHVREGILVYNEETGGWGDIAPLPGFSRESLSDIHRVLKASPQKAERFPCVRFAWACAERPAGGEVKPVGVNFLWIPEMESLESLLGRLAGVKQPCVKVKLGPDPNVEGLLTLISRCEGVRVRLDPNRRWDVDTAYALVKALPSEALEYVEEPFQDVEDYGRLWRRCEVPIGLDESLLGDSGFRLAESPHVVALVLKPTLMGNARDCAPWVRLAGDSGKQVVWSSCFESGVGLWHLAGMAQDGAVCGLDTGRVFSRDLVDPRPLPEAGVLACRGWRVMLPDLGTGDHSV